VNFTLRRYRVTVKFKNDGSVYGTEKYIVLATNEDQAERKALTQAQSSVHDDSALPDRRCYISDVEELEDGQDIAA
jgi:hypothetical protein